MSVDFQPSKINFDKGLIANTEHPIIIGFSSGFDSVACAHFLHNFGARNIVLAHFNHKMRPQNDDMESAAREYAANFGVPLIVGEPEIPIEDSETYKSKGMEAAAREYRYRFFYDVVQDVTGGEYVNFNGPIVVTAHHLDDCIENIVLSLTRYGEAQTIPRSIRLCKFGLTKNYACPIKIVRPFLKTTKSAFVSYAQSNDLDYYVVEDETNGDAECADRNFVRHEIVPKLLNLNEGLHKVIARKV